MKKMLLLLNFIWVAASAQTTYPSGVTNCIARWDFSSNGVFSSLPDVSGNGNNSSVVEDLTATEGWRGVPSKAAKFNGSSSYAQIPNSSILKPDSAVTIIALVQADGFYEGVCQFSQIFIKGYPAYIPGQYAMAIGDDIYDEDCYDFDAEHQQLIGYFYNSHIVSGIEPDSGNYITTGKWYFLAIAFNGTSIQYYQVPMDTANYYSSISPVYSSTFSSSLGTNDQDALIGRTLNPPYPYWFNGKMDELALFNRVLVADEIHSVYDFLWNEGISGTTDLKEQVLNINLFPNPNTGSFTIAATTRNNEIIRMEVRSTIGQLLYSQAMTPVNGNIRQQVNIPAKIPPGNYFIVLKQADKRVVKPITVR